MQLFKSASGFGNTAQKAARAFTKWFPTPEMIYPRAAGIDISDASIKWIVLAPFKSRYRIESHGEILMEQGVVVSGVVQDEAALARALTEVKKHLGGIECAHAALPEEIAYVFEMHVPEGTTHDQAISMIEFGFEGRVPIAPGEAVFDFDVIQKHGSALYRTRGFVRRSRRTGHAARRFRARTYRLCGTEAGDSDIHFNRRRRGRHDYAFCCGEIVSISRGDTGVQERAGTPRGYGT